VSRRASLPGAEELFRRTDRPERTERRQNPPSPDRQVDKSSPLQVAGQDVEAGSSSGKAPKHEEKITFYCTRADLMALEQARLRLRGDHATSADRGRIVRAAVAYVLEDFDARGEDSILLNQLRSE
jgi:hypothetical protein